MCVYVCECVCVFMCVYVYTAIVHTVAQCNTGFSLKLDRVLLHLISFDMTFFI